MKKNTKYLLLLPLSLITLVSCSEGNPSTSLPSSTDSSTSLPSSELPSSSLPSSETESSTSSSTPEEEVDPDILTALESLKGNSHEVRIDYQVQVLHPGVTGAVDLELNHEEERHYSYTENEDGTIERGYHAEGQNTNYDIQNGERIESSRRVYPMTPVTLFEEEDTGLAVMESLTVDNRVETAYLSGYDETTGVYDPVLFNADYTNPWDYIQADDLFYDDDGNLHLSLEKADFLRLSYGATSVNWITDCKLTTNSQGQIVLVDFLTDDLVGETFTRASSMSLTYSDFGTPLNHVVPLENDNPELEEALKSLVNAKNFTYKKTLTYEGTSTETTGYYDREKGLVYFHQGNSQSLYEGGDNYDYVAAYQQDGANAGSYVGYNYISSDYGSWSWDPITVSSSALYTIPSWESLIPAFDQVSANVFTLENGVYVPESSLLPTIGGYFDNPFYGVNSEALTTSGTKLEITLENGVLTKIEASFGTDSSEYDVTFELSAIDNTTLPDFFLDSWNPEDGGILD